MPRINNWVIVSRDKKNYLYGEVHQDFRFDDGTAIVTSEIKDMSLADGIIETQNTRYQITDTVGEISARLLALGFETNKGLTKPFSG